VFVTVEVIPFSRPRDCLAGPEDVAGSKRLEPLNLFAQRRQLIPAPVICLNRSTIMTADRIQERQINAKSEELLQPAIIENLVVAFSTTDVAIVSKN